MSAMVIFRPLFPGSELGILDLLRKDEVIGAKVLGLLWTIGSTILLSAILRYTSNTTPPPRPRYSRAFRP
jgi:hypothetical protein